MYEEKDEEKEKTVAEDGKGWGQFHGAPQGRALKSERRHARCQADKGSFVKTDL